jgi:anaerobic ribonucleoside-triphosphate reductase activating protein
MLIHSMLPRSAVNGPGERAVVWFQGCDLRCRGCFNPTSHPFGRDRDKRVEEVAEWVLACQGIEGLTFSGGEPFQQAGDLRHLCEYIKLRQPDFSIGVFSGHTLRELVRGRWHWKAPGNDAWIKGDPALFIAIKQLLDFGVFGRFRQNMVCNDKPLCGSRNQEVVLFSDRYSPCDLVAQGFEVTISGDGGSTIITGFPPASILQRLDRAECIAQSTGDYSVRGGRGA